MENGWSQKQIHRLIVTSATYRQASLRRADLERVDPYNKWLGRQARFRLDAEVVRDLALASSGLLSAKMGGPGVFPPQPEGCMDLGQHRKTWKASSGEDRFRRAAYTYRWRNTPHPALKVFDAPAGLAACTRRLRSNTPLQALTLMNDPAFVELAVGLARRLMAEADSAANRIRLGFQLCLGREPDAEELRLLTGLVESQRSEFAVQPAEARAVVAKAKPLGQDEAAGRRRRSVGGVDDGGARAAEPRRDNHPRMMNDLTDSQAQQMDLQQATRRHFFSQCSMGLGSIALGSLLGGDLAKAASANPFQPGEPHFRPRAKNVIFMFMAGGPSQFELFDWKPELARRSGGDIPDSFVKGKRFAFMNSSFKNQKKLLGPVKQFRQHGQAGMWFSDNIPHIGGIADEMTMFRTCKTNLFNHAPAKLFMNTGTGIFGRPSMGSWVTYGIGSETQSLPGFVVLHSGSRGPRGGAANWSSGFLPTTYQGVPLRGSGDPILNLANPAGVSRERQRASIDIINKLNLKRWWRPVIPRSTRASPRTRWRTACSPARRS